MSQTTRDPVLFALVGLGGIGGAHLQALDEVDGAKLAAIVEPRREVGEAAARAAGVPWYAKHSDAELLDGIDAAIVAAPPNLHFEITQDLLMAGKHVLCEKPFTLTSPQARELAGAARSQDRLLMMASKFRYVDDLKEAKRLIEAGALGDVILYENAFFGRVAMAERWNANKAVSGGGVIMDNGTHSLDIARYLLGDIASVQATAGRSVQGLDVEDTACVQFKTRSGVLGTISLSWSLNGGDSYVNIFGTKGNLIVEWKGSRYKKVGESDWTRFGTGYGKIPALSGQIRNMVASLAGAEAPRITPDDAIASVRAVEAAYASMDHGGWVPMELG